ncbi:hypothetical protein E2C01_101252 [Portunus trituberculatus]|uniref:Uncharacterized protein n=1 Tax=Portunus trituberculatus TaxID=210409 RepID=A0A5B7KLH7_PORTR|nr:hypothetical protein [Portunus trituberculatus]
MLVHRVLLTYTKPKSEVVQHSKRTPTMTGPLGQLVSMGTSKPEHIPASRRVTFAVKARLHLRDAAPHIVPFHSLAQQGKHKALLEPFQLPSLQQQPCPVSSS